MNKEADRTLLSTPPLNIQVITLITTCFTCIFVPFLCNYSNKNNTSISINYSNKKNTSNSINYSNKKNTSTSINYSNKRTHQIQQKEHSNLDISTHTLMEASLEKIDDSTGFSLTVRCCIEKSGYIYWVMMFCFTLRQVYINPHILEGWNLIWHVDLCHYVKL